MKIVWFGTGQVAHELSSYILQDYVDIVAVCDSDIKKQGNLFMGHTVCPPEDISQLNSDFVFVATVKNISPIKQQLISIGVPDNKLIFAVDPEFAKYVLTTMDLIFKIPKCNYIQFRRKPAEIYRVYAGETTKAYSRRIREGFFEKYCQGEGVDIGYGGDVITPDCAGWDFRNGDAQYLAGIDDNSFDFVYSSHCLEHMVDVRVALHNWFRVVKPGGWLLLYIPHRDLYEKRTCLPSVFNPDHKHMFLIGHGEFPDTLDIVEEISRSLTNYRIQYIKICDEGYVPNMPEEYPAGEYSIEAVIQKLP